MLNTSLKGKECHVFLVHDKVSAFRKKLDLWCARVEQGSVEMFPTLEYVMEKAELAVASVQIVWLLYCSYLGHVLFLVAYISHDLTLH